MSKENEVLYSEDGYLIDQNLLAGYTYRRTNASINGCGPVAAYNLFRYMEIHASFDEVIAALDAQMPRFPGPTRLRPLWAYLSLRLPTVETAKGKQACLQLACQSRAGVLRYIECPEPHYIMYYRLPDGRCRFFNVRDGEEDIACDMQEFFRGHVSPGVTALLAVPQKQALPEEK